MSHEVDRIVNQPHDFTIAILARILLLAKGEEELVPCQTALTKLSQPAEISETHYHAYHRHTGTPVNFFDRMQLGLENAICPEHDFLPSMVSGSRVFERLISHLVHHTPSHTASSNLVESLIELMIKLVYVSKWERDSDRNFLQSVFRSTQLFSFLLRDVAMDPKNLSPSTESTPSQIYEILLVLTSVSTDVALERIPEGRRDLIKTWCKVGLLDTLEKIIASRGDGYPELYRMSHCL